MRGALISDTWHWNPTSYAPARYRRNCLYDTFVPERLAQLSLQLSGDVAGIVSDAEKAIADLHRAAGPELAPLASAVARDVEPAS